jgi:predicted MFS family arabinose efflux permease
LLLVTDWRTVFMLVGIPGLIMAAVMFFLVRERAHRPGRQHAGGAPGFADLFRHRNVPLRCSR